MLVFFHLALRRMAERQRQSQPEVDWSAIADMRDHLTNDANGDLNATLDRADRSATAMENAP